MEGIIEVQAVNLDLGARRFLAQRVSAANGPETVTSPGC